MRSSFNRNLAITILCIWILVGAKLYTTAMVTDNMRGCFYSILHLIIVGIGTYLVLKKPANTQA